MLPINGYRILVLVVMRKLRRGQKIIRVFRLRAIFQHRRFICKRGDRGFVRLVGGNPQVAAQGVVIVIERVPNVSSPPQYPMELSNRGEPMRNER